MKLRASSLTKRTRGSRSRWPVKSPKRPLTVPMMSLLISTAVTICAPKASAESTSRPPPAPMTSASPPGPQVVADVGDVVLQVLDARRGRRRSRVITVPAATSMSICSCRTRRSAGSVGLSPQPCGGTLGVVDRRSRARASTSSTSRRAAAPRTTPFDVEDAEDRELPPDEHRVAGGRDRRAAIDAHGRRRAAPRDPASHGERDAAEARERTRPRAPPSAVGPADDRRSAARSRAPRRPGRRHRAG